MSGPAGGALRARRLAGLALAAVLLAGGCRFELDLDVVVEPDGSGWVQVTAALDDDAVERIGGDLAAVLAVDDLADAGWEVTGPARDGDGFTRVRAAKGFATPEASVAVLAEATGRDGPLRGFGATRRQSFARTEWGFEGRVDLSGGLAAFGDDDLAAELDGEPIGRSVEEIERQLGASLDDLVELRVSVRLPGDVAADAGAEAVRVDGARWILAFEPGPVDLSATGTERRTAVVLWAGAGALLGLALAAVLVVRLVGLVRGGRGDAGAPPSAAPAGGAGGEVPTGEGPPGAPKA